MHKSTLPLVMAAALACSACLVATAESAEPTPLELQQQLRINALNSEFLAARLADGGLVNTMVSPVSLFYALAVLREGADGAAARTIETRLLQADGSELLPVAEPLYRLVQRDSDDGGRGAFRLANSVWSSSGDTTGMPYVFDASFALRVGEAYGAEVESTDFAAPDAAAAVNRWASDNTNGLIPRVIDDATMAELVWLIMNAAYFEGAWAKPMVRVDAGVAYEFRYLDGTRRALPHVVGRQTFAVVDGDDGSVAFALPFLGGQYAMVVYAPQETHEDMPAWLQGPGVTGLPAVTSALFDAAATTYDFTLKMPLFSYSDSVKLTSVSPVTDALGLSPLFAAAADYLRLVDREQSHPAVWDTGVSFIQQDTRIELDEKGVKAAAVTLVAGAVKSTNVRPSYPRREIVIDRPFSWAIVDRPSQAILFSGVVVTPEA